MAIEVIGKDESKKWKATCNNCSAILLYLPVDVKYSTSSDYSGVSDTTAYIKCPECKNTIYVKG